MTATLSRFHTSMVAESAWYALVAEFVAEVRSKQSSMLAKQAAYSLLYAVPSMLVVLVSLAAVVDKNSDAEISNALFRAISAQAPPDLRPLLESLVHIALVKTSAQTAVLAVIVSLAIAAWGGAGGVGALVYAINRVYGIRDSRSFVKGACLNVGLMLLGGTLVITAFLLLTLGRVIGAWLATQIGSGSALVGVLTSGPVWALVLLFCSLLLLYWFGLDSPKSLRWLLPGAVVATLAIALILAVFGVILSISNPGTAYGAAGSVIVLLRTHFVVSAIVVGAIFNAVLGRRFDRTLNDGVRRQPEKQLDRFTIAVTEFT